MNFRVGFLGFVLASTACAQSHQPVLMISVDGMRPDYVTQADAHHLKVPNLRRVMAEGTHAAGVQGVFPTITYASHTTLATGVWPAEHGIPTNARFDPTHQLAGAWYWYADQIKAPTLWAVAHQAGLHTASVSWPATVNSVDIDYLLPEYWRTPTLDDQVNPDDRLLLSAVSRPVGELARIAERTKTPYMRGNETTIEGDEIRTKYSLDILAQHKPEFMTIHLSSLDEEEHLHGPFSAEADADLEAIDGMLGRLIAQELKNYPDAAIVIVSDHGFGNAVHSVNLAVAFAKAGLSGDDYGKGWQAKPWASGGIAAIMLRDPHDAAVKERVRVLLKQIAADPKNGVEAVLEQPAVTARGGFPEAAFAVTFKPGYFAGTRTDGPLVTPADLKGMHGYDPTTHDEMLASFFAMGKVIAAGKNLGRVDMRSVAPTVASLLGVALPSAKQPPLPLH